MPPPASPSTWIDREWERLGAVATERPRFDLRQASRYCRDLALSHYENFSVASFLIPRRLRPHFFHVYAFCRWSDDLGDESSTPGVAIERLAWWQDQLDACFAGRTATHPVMIALQSTIERFQLSQVPFDDLLSAFRQDQHVTRYATDADLEDYCRRSANPVGRILLQMAGVSEASSLARSDQICSGLQLANFCQDLSRDAALGRIYFPQSRWPDYAITETLLLERKGTPALKRAAVDWAIEIRERFIDGWPLTNHVPRWLSQDIRMFAGGGIAILDQIIDRKGDVWSERVSLERIDKLRVFARALTTRKPPIRRTVPPVDRGLNASYRQCELIARGSGSNFYRSFSLLRPEKRRGMTALYALARLIDDVGDSPSQPLSDSIDWLHDWIDRRAKDKRADDAVWIESDCDPSNWSAIAVAVSDTIERFHIPVVYLHDLVEGVRQDMQGPVRIETREALERYCYQVASTVGLACLSIWGVAKEQNGIEQSAIDCGIAFQLTNILRDLREDNQRNRLYVPLDLLSRHGVDPEEWLAGRARGKSDLVVREMIEWAHAAYASGWKLHSALTDDGQRMFSLMWHTYRRLLLRIESRVDQLWEERLKLSRSEKLWLYLRHAFTPWYRIANFTGSRSE